MNIASSQCQSKEILDLCHQISALEERYVEHFIGEGNRALLKKIHVQIKLLKMELQFQKTKVK